MNGSGPPHAHDTHHAYMGWGATPKSYVGFRKSEFPPLLLGKWAMIGLLSQNLFCQLQAKIEWLTILESLKRKTKVLLWAQRTKQGGALKSLKGYIHISVVFIWGSTLNFFRWYCSSISIFTCFGEALALGWPWSLSLCLPLLLRLHVQFP